MRQLASAQLMEFSGRFLRDNESANVRALQRERNRSASAMVNSAIAVDRNKGAARAVKFFDVKKATRLFWSSGVRVVAGAACDHAYRSLSIHNTSLMRRTKVGIIRELGEELRRATQRKEIVLRTGDVRTGAGEQLLTDSRMMADFGSSASRSY